MNKIILLLILLFTSGFSLSQQLEYPIVQSTGIAIHDFLPKGWSVLKSCSGDLNGDKKDDIAFVIQYKDSITILDRYGDDKEYVDTVRCQPRILVITFYDTELKRLKKIAQTNSFILCHHFANMDDPFEDMSITNQFLKLDFRIWYSMGSWSTSNYSFKFRFMENEFKLIGADYISLHRASGDFENRSYNFLSKRLKITIGYISRKKEDIKWKKFEIHDLKTFKTFLVPMTWKISEDFTL